MVGDSELLGQGEGFSGAVLADISHIVNDLARKQCPTNLSLNRLESLLESSRVPLIVRKYMASSDGSMNRVGLHFWKIKGMFW